MAFCTAIVAGAVARDCADAAFGLETIHHATYAIKALMGIMVYHGAFEKKVM